MKKNLLLRLCLTMVVVLSFHSCRQDFLPEKETYHNSGAFQLKSNRISLNESKHKVKLLPELEKAEAKFKEKNFSFGKIVNYGDGVSIDTDEVTYIENGPNYHTYTFNIQRENAPADAPLENLQEPSYRWYLQRTSDNVQFHTAREANLNEWWLCRYQRKNNSNRTCIRNI